MTQPALPEPALPEPALPEPALPQPASPLRSPAFASLAFTDIPVPDWAAVTVVALPPDAPVDPEAWARAVFDFAAAPRWVQGLMAVRQSLVGLFGIERGSRGTFAVDRVEAGEAYVYDSAGHLDFGAAVAADPGARLLRVTTAVRLKGWRGRLYFLPVRLLHDPVTRAMMRSAVHRLTAGRSTAG